MTPTTLISYNLIPVSSFFLRKSSRMVIRSTLHDVRPWSQHRLVHVFRILRLHLGYLSIPDYTSHSSVVLVQMAINDSISSDSFLVQTGPYSLRVKPLHLSFEVYLRDVLLSSLNLKGYREKFLVRFFPFSV